MTWWVYRQRERWCRKRVISADLKRKARLVAGGQMAELTKDFTCSGMGKHKNGDDPCGVECSGNMCWWHPQSISRSFYQGEVAYVAWPECGS